MLLYVMLGIIIVLLTVAYMAGANGQQVAKQTILHIQTLDQIYDRFLEEQLNNGQTGQQDLDALCQSAFALLQEEVQKLTQFINQTYLRSIAIPYESKYFIPVVILCEDFFRTSSKNPNHRLSEKDEQLLKDTVLDAIRSDLQTRTLKINV